MSAPLFDSDACAVLACYLPAFRPGVLTPLGNRGGFSGAALWRIDAAAGPLCLRAWPAHETWPRLVFRHQLMTQARQQGLPFIPAVYATLDRAPAVEQRGRLWELTEWMPGRADYSAAPSPARLEAACTALAQLHTIWRVHASEPAGCPAVERRLEFVAQWRQLLRSGWHPALGAGDPLTPLVERAWRRLPAAVERVPERLQLWIGSRQRRQPCLCDVWHDHLLFEGDRLTGLIDYGAVKVDHVAVDLARMLGSLVQHDTDAWRAGLQAYRRLAPLDAEEEQLAYALDETGTVLGAANWLRWLYEEKRPSPDWAAVARRFAEVVERLEVLIP
jgi:homoserine kinase type II